MLLTLARLTAEERKVIFLSALGGALEFYDFIIYVFFAKTLSVLFFPEKNHLASLMGIFAVFAIGYLARPIGGIVFSHFGDKYGRKKTFILTLILMALPTFLIGFLPTHDMIGIWAPTLLIIFRLLQGLSVGGEIPGAITFAGEHVESNNRGLTCAIIFFGINTGLLLGSAVSVMMVSLLSPEQLTAWGWRLPFIFGGFLGVISFYLRKRMSETPIFQSFEAGINHDFPIVEVLRNYWPQVLRGIALTWLGAVIVCLLLLYMPSYLTDILNYPKTLIGELNTLTILAFSITLIVAGWLSDLYGRRLFLLIASIGFLLCGYGVFFLLAQQHIAYVLLVMLGISIIGACSTGVYPCALLELFPTNVRYTGIAIAYNIGFGVFGGLSPLIATYLIHVTGNVLAPSIYLIISAFACLCATIKLKNRNNEPLSNIK